MSGWLKSCSYVHLLGTLVISDHQGNVKKDVSVAFVNTPACRNVEKKKPTEARAVVTPARAGDVARVPGVTAI